MRALFLFIALIVATAFLLVSTGEIDLRTISILATDRQPYPGKVRSIWEKNLKDEESFWKDFVKNKGWKKWKERYKVSLDAESPLQDVFLEHIDPTVKVTKILDLGSGPLTTINKKCDSCEIEIIAVDPLADFYNEVLAEHDIQPIVSPQEGYGETLTQHFAENTFHIAYSRNPIDHSYDPVKCIEQMIKVTKEKHYIIIELFENEGSNQDWHGLHQWDFFLAKTLPLFEKHFFVQGKNTKTVDITDHFRASAQTVSLNRNGRFLTVVMKKLPLSG